MNYIYNVREYIIFLNNDTKIITENWIEEMLMYSQRDDVGAVGAMLYYPDNTIQHGGVGFITAGDQGFGSVHIAGQHAAGQLVDDDRQELSGTA